MSNDALELFEERLAQLLAAVILRELAERERGNEVERPATEAAL